MWYKGLIKRGEDKRGARKIDGVTVMGSPQRKTEKFTFLCEKKPKCTINIISFIFFICVIHLRGGGGE